MTLAWVAGPVIGGWLGERHGIGLPFVLVGVAILGTVYFTLTLVLALALTVSLTLNQAWPRRVAVRLGQCLARHEP